jgi:hypothetical protein
MEISQATAPVNLETTFNVVLEYDDDGKEKTGFVVVGIDSPQCKAEAARQRKADFKKRINGNKPTNFYKTEDGQAALDVNTQANMTAMSLIGTVDWFGFTENDAPKPFDRDVLAQMFAARMSWRDQVYSTINDATNFLPKPVKA